MRGIPGLRRLPRTTWIGGVATALALVAMYFDHIALGADDWAAFAISAVVILVTAGYVFGVLVKSVRGNAERAGHLALVVGLIAVPSVALIWVGPPWVIAGGAVALGVEGHEGRHRWRARIGLVLGLLVLLLCVVGSDWQADS